MTTASPAPTAFAGPTPAAGADRAGSGPEAAGIIDWMHEPSTDAGIHVQSGKNDWNFHSYSSISDRAFRVADGLRRAGIRPGDVVALMQSSGVDFVAAFYGTLAAGAMPSAISPPVAFHDKARYDEHVRAVATAAGARLTVCDDDLAAEVTTIIGGALPVVPFSSLIDAARTPSRQIDRDPSDPALIQFTSGSSGTARGVRVAGDALATHVTAIGKWLGMRPGDATASWLPVHHDMGLIGCLLTPIHHQTTLWSMAPTAFIRRPLRFVELFDANNAQLTAMPSFGLDYIVRRVRPEQVAELDLSAWRAIIVGAERVDEATVEAFCDLLAPAGLDPQTILPAYGLAEATLAVTGLALDEPWRSIEPPGTPNGVPLVGCGRPLDGVTVTVVDDDHNPVPDGTLGEIHVRSTSLADGYVGENTSTTRFTDRGLDTGDAGCMVDGQLFVVGRLGDSVKVRGRSIFAEDIEARLCAAGLKPNRVAAAFTTDPASGTTRVVVALEGAGAEAVATATTALEGATEAMELTVRSVPAGAIPRTSSGKPRRRALWHAMRQLDERIAATGDATPMATHQ